MNVLYGLITLAPTHYLVFIHKYISIKCISSQLAILLDFRRVLSDFSEALFSFGFSP
jgi:hypothetical protein